MSEAGRSNAPLEGQVALVTGGSRGIGRAVALELARQGARVGITYRERADAAAEVLTEISSVGGEGVAISFDVGDAEACASGVKGFAKDQGGLDVLVNNAGISLDGLVMRYSVDDWHRIVDVNLGGVFHASRAAARVMVRARRGRIINLSSVISAIGNAGQAPYAATKSGIEGLTRAMARELASRSVTVNAVAPGFIDTEMTQALPEDLRGQYLGQVPLGRLGTATEVARLVGFLAGPDAAYITGQVIGINGGLHM